MDIWEHQGEEETKAKVETGGGDVNDIWEHQREEETKAKVETGGGDVNVIQEDGADIESIYARMIAKGILGSALLHSTANARTTSEAQAITMMKNAKKCPQYMNISEKNRIIKKINEQAAKLEEIKEERSKYDGNK